MSFNEIHRKITEVYLSNMRFKLKNDCVCRLLSKTFNLSSVSILLYESKSDTLLNFGHYLDVDNSTIKFKNDSAIDEKTLRNINLYEYFSAKFDTQSSDTCNLHDYKSNPFFYSDTIFHRNITSSKITNEFFNKEKKEAKYVLEKNIDGIYRKCLTYKKIISNYDKYDLVKAITISGCYFRDLIIGNLTKEEKSIKTATSYEIVNSNKILNITYNILNIHLGENYGYLALPLFVKGRYIGLVRVLSFDKSIIDVTLQNSHLKNHIKRLKKELFEDLNEIVKTKALFVGNYYYEYEFKKFSKVGLLDFKNHSILLSAAINSHSCIIRASEDRGKNSEIKGYTPTIEAYVEEIKKLPGDPFNTHKNVIKQFFEGSTKNESVSKVIGIQFELQKNKISNIKYYYFVGDEMVKSSKNHPSIKNGVSVLEKVFPELLLKKLCEKNLNQILIFEIPYVEDSYLTFANSIFRNFITDDVDIIYPQVNRLGSELQKLQTNVLEMKNHVLSSILHDLRLPFSSLLKTSNKINLLLSKIASSHPRIFNEHLHNQSNSLEYSKTDKYLPKLFENTLQFIQFQFNKFKISSEMENELFPDNYLLNSHFNLFEGILWFTYSIEDFALESKHLRIIKDFKIPKRDKKLHLRYDYFASLFFYLMENAIKYSFQEEARYLKITNYNPSEKSNTDGHIKVVCFNKTTSYGYSITNWGKRISDDEVKDIFKRGQRGKIDSDFEISENSTPGDGIGLYNAQIISERMGSDITIKREGYKTTFVVSWQKIKRR